MTDKSSFILYTEFADDFAMLSNEEAGAVIKAIFLYTTEGKETEFSDRAVKMIYSHITSSIDRNSDKWEETRVRRSEAGRLGGAPKGNTNAQKQNNQNKQMVDLVELNKQNNQMLDLLEQNNQKQAKQAKQAVSVSVSDSVNVSDSVSGSVSVSDGPECVVDNSPPATTAASLLTLEDTYAFTLTSSQAKDIELSLNDRGLGEDFLKFVADVLMSKYGLVKPALFYTACTKWQDIEDKFRAFVTEREKETVEVKSCPECGSNLFPHRLGSFCYVCLQAYNSNMEKVDDNG